MDESVPEEPEESDEPDGAAGSVSEEPLPLLSDLFGTIRCVRRIIGSIVIVVIIIRIPVAVMACAALRRYVILCEIFCPGRTAARCKEPCCGTYRFLYDRSRNREIFVSKILMDPFHNIFPQPLVPALALSGHCLVAVVSAPGQRLYNTV